MNDHLLVAFWALFPLASRHSCRPGTATIHVLDEIVQAQGDQVIFFHETCSHRLRLPVRP